MSDGEDVFRSAADENHCTNTDQKGIVEQECQNEIQMLLDKTKRPRTARRRKKVKVSIILRSRFLINLVLSGLTAAA